MQISVSQSLYWIQFSIFRLEPTGKDAEYNLKIKVDGNWLNHDGQYPQYTYCWENCIFNVSFQSFTTL